MLSVFEGKWEGEDNLLNVNGISANCAHSDLSSIFNRIRQLATQIIKS
jgi:hypothetical protein